MGVVLRGGDEPLLGPVEELEAEVEVAPVDALVAVALASPLEVDEESPPAPAVVVVSNPDELLTVAAPPAPAVLPSVLVRPPTRRYCYTTKRTYRVRIKGTKRYRRVTRNVRVCSSSSFAKRKAVAQAAAARKAAAKKAAAKRAAAKRAAAKRAAARRR